MKQLKEIELGEGDFIVLKSQEKNTFKENIFVRDADYPGCWQSLAVDKLSDSQANDNVTVLKIAVDSIFKAHEAINKISSFFANQKGYWAAVSLKPGVQSYVKFELDNNGDTPNINAQEIYAMFSHEQNSLDILDILKPFNIIELTPIHALTTAQIAMYKPVIGY